MNPVLELTYRENRIKLVNAMLEQEETWPYRQYYACNTGEGVHYCTLGLAFELMVQKYPDRLSWSRLDDNSLFPVVKNPHEIQECITADIAQDVIACWLGLDEPTLFKIIEENDLSCEDSTWMHMAEVVSNLPYREAPKLWEGF